LHTYDKVSHVPFLFESPVSAQGSLNTLSHVYIVSRGMCKQTEESLLSIEENVNLAGKKKINHWAWSRESIVELQ